MSRTVQRGRGPQQAAAQAGLAQEGPQHGRGRVQVRDDPVPQRVDDLDVLGFLPGQRIGGQAHGGDLAGGPVDGDRRGFLDHDAAAQDTDERVDRAEVDRYASSQPHGTRPLP
jgi:hypothetical protein